MFDYNIKESKFIYLHVIKNFILNRKSEMIIFKIFNKAYYSQGRKFYRFNWDIQ